LHFHFRLGALEVSGMRLSVQTLRYLVIATFFFGPSDSIAQSAAAQGRILDESDHAIPFARIVASYADGNVDEVRTDENGRFNFELKGNLPVRLQVYAPGYAAAQRELADLDSGEISIRLGPSRLADSVTVTATRGELPISRSTQSVTLLSDEDQQMSPALTLDDFLRRVPGFTLFRRTSSLVAHPTAQGVSLRGVGPSGASRSLVLADGIPLNDPFGGWVYWSRVPRLSIDRTEILRGGASELYGTDALGGVIQVFRRAPASRTLNLEGYLGNFQTSDYAFQTSHRFGRHGVALSGDVFRTEGYIQVAPLERGPVDIASRSKHRALEALWDYQFGPNNRIFVVASDFSEERGNGTPLQTNDTQMKSLAAGASFVTGGNEWSVQSFALSETFDALFSSVALDRTSELLTRSQRVPAQSAGGQALWRRPIGTKHLLIAGGDYVQVKGASDELAYTAGISTGTSRVDGRQDRGGFYFQDLWQIHPRLQAVLGMRWDGWSNHDAYLFATTFSTGAARQTPFSSRSDTAWSPKVGARLDLDHDFWLRGSISRSFRAPTLNELYRGFRVGNVVTNPNGDLRPEHASGGEIGLDWGLRKPVSIQGTVFSYEIEDNIANVTLSSTPALITRQRQNLGSTRSRGVELDAVYRPDTRWTFGAGYFFSDATVRSAPAAPDLVGLRIPQVPRHQAVFQTSYHQPERFFVYLMLRVSSSQFDDDQNQFLLGAYQLLDFSIGKPLTRFAELFFACENLFDRSYAVGRTPVETLGMPRRYNAGIRFKIE
jgi:outer membrane receptor protein involved in Fe transport